MSSSQLKHAQNLLTAQQYAQAAKAFENIVDEQTQNVAAYTGLALCNLSLGNHFEALGCAVDACQFGGYQPSELVVLLKVLTSGRFSSYLKPVEKALHKALEHKYLEGQAVELLRIQLMSKYKKVLEESIVELNEPLEDMLGDPTFYHVVSRTIIANHQLEKVILLGRKELLRCIANNLDARHYLPTMAAIACQNLLNDGLYHTTEEEEQLLAQLEACEPVFKSEAVALKLCYASFDEAMAIWAQADDAFDNYKLNELATDLDFYQSVRSGAIEIASELNNETSKTVQSFYKENPYPKYKVVNMSALSVTQCMARLGMKAVPAPNILIAGCGTGLQVIELAFANPDGHITAIDISPMSISYAQQMVKRYQLSNVEFRLLDILEAKQLAQQYDFIISTGVLHHMASPESGLKVLAELLKPQRTMVLGFYSELGRRELPHIRKSVLSFFGSDNITKEQLPLWRSQWSEQQKSEAWFNSNDFFNSNGMMDAIFHPQEAYYDLPTLEKMLTTAGLNFGSMALNNVQKARYQRALDDFEPLKSGESLSHWAEFEQLYPDFFMGMYNFFAIKQ
ncbi:hypothetical protein PA25_35780 [Pseudoalteromonas sp. A25]|uniref:class I SAM-dependent methyltransferase n=1 Tax=Pseudoalteromonas sp. A25 TaxID=116092 RepID=UPI0012606279|nr:class I SAM-dependent methyltransferase [Pseudoalteromonas sp. A25]BBN83593.1 hypothetical protein PA25_35780 [Pseudoalteromonas sp. A25]